MLSFIVSVFRVLRLIDVSGLNHGWIKAWSGYNLSMGSFFSNLVIKSLASPDMNANYSSGKVKSPYFIFSTRSFKYSELNGSEPESIEYNMQPTLHISTIYVYPSPVNISGAEKATVPV